MLQWLHLTLRPPNKPKSLNCVYFTASVLLVSAFPNSIKQTAAHTFCIKGALLLLLPVVTLLQVTNVSTQPACCSVASVSFCCYTVS
jgi:hypothetical protein